MIDVNYTHHEVVVLHGVDTITQNVGIDAKNATTSYVVIDDIVYKEIKTRDQLKQALIEIDQNYQDKEVTDFPSQTHENIRHELKIRDPSIEFLAPVAQSKKQFI